jgi:hypothetical protein
VRGKLATQDPRNASDDGAMRSINTARTTYERSHETRGPGGNTLMRTLESLQRDRLPWRDLAVAS